ncbi:MAG: tyrosine-type recombinase/integrase [Paracoccaceae bacterium]|nr:tyrosine-type recombinase/integrase [Paracoccaceae bacterium]
MTHTINSQFVLSRTPDGPLAAFLDGFASFAGTQGYTPKSVHRRLLLAACFSQWLKKEGIGISDITSDHPARYLRHRAGLLRVYQHDHFALGHFIEFLRLEGVIPPEKIPVCHATEAESLVQAYEQYLRETCGLAAATIMNYVPFVRSFLRHRFGAGQVALSQLSASDIIGFVQHTARGVHRKQAKLMTTALRSFLRYVCYRGEGMPDLVATVPTVANWSMTSLPRAISADQVNRVLASIDRSTAVGRRDYAILLLFARLGLRLGEVAFLELDDIDWASGTLHLRTKGGIRNTFPLSHEVGAAIADYLRHGRPRCSSRRVFLRVRPPIGGFRSVSGIGSVVRHVIERAGVDAPTRGAHQFRHGLATGMLRHGASLTEIGDILGHRHPDTTRIYTRVDLEALRTLALPWPGGVR